MTRETNKALVRKAHQEYGDLIARIVTWPEGLGIDVHLVGGEVVQCFPSGQRYSSTQATVLERTQRRV
ncbi:hypothetical protein [Leucobacter celer]|uniref:hypothetical protein n=1 Tax=Leucobacter celer TaxID=668625 RepID=UPI000AA95679|nr:hypothetical protein [Leucobacter celer]